MKLLNRARAREPSARVVHRARALDRARVRALVHARGHSALHHFVGVELRCLTAAVSADTDRSMGPLSCAVALALLFPAGDAVSTVPSPRQQEYSECASRCLDFWMSACKARVFRDGSALTFRLDRNLALSAMLMARCHPGRGSEEPLFAGEAPRA